MNDISWSEIKLEQDISMQTDEIFRGLTRTAVRGCGDDSREYVLICEENAIQFKVSLDNILSPRGDPNDPYKPKNVLDALRVCLHGNQGQAFLHFLRYSPWLVADLSLEETVPSWHYGVMLGRLLEQLATLLKEECLTGSRLRDTYRLLLRARYLVLVELTKQRGDVEEYLPELDSEVREAWQAWGETLLEAPQEVGLLLDRYGGGAEVEGQRLLFRPDGSTWPFTEDGVEMLFTQRLFRRWFLPRYDVQGVMQALAQLPGRLPGLRRKLPRLQTASVWLALGGLGLPLLWELLWPGHTPVWLVTGAWWLACLLVLAALATSWLESHLLQYSLPRITLAIFVGYLALVSSSELMTLAILAFSDHQLLALALAAVSLLMAFAAIYVEARRYVGDGPLAVHRAGRVLFIAGARALTIGWLLLAPAGSLLLDGVDATNNVLTWSGPLRMEIYPQLIFVLAPLALFIGIFVQTIWEENPLTHPLQ